jgi:hypothetical protein
METRAEGGPSVTDWLRTAEFKKPAPPAARAVKTPRKVNTPYVRVERISTPSPRGNRIIQQRRVSKTTDSEGEGRERLIAGTSMTGYNQQEDADEYMLPDIHDSSDTE